MEYDEHTGAEEPLITGFCARIKRSQSLALCYDFLLYNFTDLVDKSWRD